MRVAPAALTLLVVLAGCSTPPPTEAVTLAEFGVDGDPMLGDPDAPVQVVAFEAPACSVCRNFHHNTWPDLRADYAETGRIGWHLQAWSIGYSYDDRGNLALECVHREGGDDASWPFLDFIYSGTAYSGHDEAALRQGLRDAAAAHGLDEETLLACYDSGETQDEVDADIQAGVQNGARGSPVFFILGPAGTDVVQGTGGLRERIEAALAA